MDKIPIENEPSEVDAQVRIGIRQDRETGEHAAFISIGPHGVQFDADTADQLAADLREIAVQLRNGGRLT